MRTASFITVAARYWVRKARKSIEAGPLTDISKLRNQAVFMMGAGGSGKGYVAYKWLKFIPGGGEVGLSREQYEALAPDATLEQARSLSNISFTNAVKALQGKGFNIKLAPEGAEIPFQLFSYDEKRRSSLIPPEEWEDRLPPAIYKEVMGLENVVFAAPVHELPSYWRQVNPDLYKEELKGYMEKEPGYVHEMSSDMNKAYFLAAVETGDPLFVDGVGGNLAKMAENLKIAKEYGYRTSLVCVSVPLTINHIRNATRDRKVDPHEVTTQWKQVESNFEALKGQADKAKKVDNRNDPKDSKKYEEFKNDINAFISKKTGKANLYEYIKEVAPGELSEYGNLIKPD